MISKRIISIIVCIACGYCVHAGKTSEQHLHSVKKTDQIFKNSDLFKQHALKATDTATDRAAKSLILDQVIKTMLIEHKSINEAGRQVDEAERKKLKNLQGLRGEYKRKRGDKDEFWQVIDVAGPQPSNAASPIHLFPSTPNSNVMNFVPQYPVLASNNNASNNNMMVAPAQNQAPTSVVTNHVPFTLLSLNLAMSAVNNPNMALNDNYARAVQLLMNLCSNNTTQAPTQFPN